MSDVLKALRAAQRRKIIVQVARHELEPPEYFMHGFVLDCSPAFVLMQVISDRLDLDGYEVLRTPDITFMDSEFPQRRFYEQALGLKQIRPVLPEGIDLSSPRALLRSVEDHYPLIVIHREWAVFEECEVGRIKMAADETYTLKYISPTAEWLDDDQVYAYEDITRVAFDGTYENTLALVAGILPE